jgi:hypothetical protein
MNRDLISIRLMSCPVGFQFKLFFLPRGYISQVKRSLYLVDKSNYRMNQPPSDIGLNLTGPDATTSYGAFITSQVHFPSDVYLIKRTATDNSIPTLVVPTVLCKIDHCGQHVTVVKSCIRQHLIAAHSYSAYKRGTSVECHWENCRCNKAGCGSRGPAHSAHVDDITEHVWNTHLNFYEACQLCGDARWAQPFARARHEAKCRGPRPARCKSCLFEFASFAALEAHNLFGICVPIVPGNGPVHL